MKTKLVYVLTCAPEKNYIEQAHMAILSARHYNPSATIVLIMDDKTDALLTGKRGEVLKYISEKIVVPFENESLTPMYRSRWIKTQVRELVEGDILFVDCDTICCGDLSGIDKLTNEVGAVGDNNVEFSKDVSRDGTIGQVASLCDISNEKYYFSSGVIYCKDTKNAHILFALWHDNWKEGVTKGLYIDQPALAKANIEMSHLIEPIDDAYNSILYTQNVNLSKALILHISSYQQTSLLFDSKILKYVKEHGMTSWVSEMILRVHATYLPYDYAIKYSNMRQRMNWIGDIAHVARMYGSHIDAEYDVWNMRCGFAPVLRQLYRCRMYGLSTFLWMEYQRLRLAKKRNLRPNVCSIEE